MKFTGSLEGPVLRKFPRGTCNMEILNWTVGEFVVDKDTNMYFQMSAHTTTSTSKHTYNQTNMLLLLDRTLSVSLHIL